MSRISDVGATRGRGLLEDLVQDVKYGVRALARSPGATLVSVLTVALGVGAATAVFSLTNALLLRPLPVAQPERLFTLDEIRWGAVARSMGHNAIPYTRYEAYREALDGVFAGLAAQRSAGFSLQAGAEATPVSGAVVSANYFDVLGVRPAAGRFFSDDHEPAVVLSHRLWRERFGGEPEVIGRTVNLDSRPFTVVGVAPRGFGGTSVFLSAQLWVPAGTAQGGAGSGFAATWVVPFGRLAPGLAPARAAAAVDAAAKSIPPDEPQTRVERARLDPLTGMASERRARVAGFIGMLLAAALLVLLIAAANIAGMLMARAVARRREIAVRLAIGAGRGRLVRQLLTESLLLFLLGAAAGVLLAWWTTNLLVSVPTPIAENLLLDLAPDLRVLGFALLVTAATGLLFGLAPALQASRTDLVTSLKDGAPGAGSHTTRSRTLFVAGQLALSVLLLITAGLLLRSLQRGLAVDPGFEPEGVVLASVNLAPHGYDEARGREFYRQLLERVREIPGVQSAALAQRVLLSGGTSRNDVEAVAEDPAERIYNNTAFNVVSPEYFETMRIDLVAGRPLTSEDGGGSEPVVVVNQTLAETLWPGRSPLGRRFRMSGTEYEVVGVVRDGRYAEVTEEPMLFSFFPFAQQYGARMTVHARTEGNAAAAVEQIREAVRQLDANVAVEDAMPYDALVGLSLFPQRFAAFLVGLFGVLGLVLAAVGVYGVLAFQVAQRTREFGIRVALGARARDVLAFVLGRGAVLAATGALVGLILAAAVTHLLQELLLGVSPLDPVTFVAVPLVLAAVALVASYIPARRAVRVSPAEALRNE